MQWSLPKPGERERGHDEGGWEETARTLLSISISRSFLPPSSDLLCAPGRHRSLGRSQSAEGAPQGMSSYHATLAGRP